MTHDLNGTSAYLLKSPDHGFVVDTLDRIDAMINRERDDSHGDVSEAQRLFNTRNEAFGELTRYRNESIGKHEVQDIDPSTGERIANPVVKDAEGNVIQGLSPHEGSDHTLLSVRLRLESSFEKADFAYKEFAKLAKERSPFRGNSNSMGRHGQGVDKFLGGLDPHSILRQFQAPKGTKASLTTLKKLGEAALQIVREALEVERSSVPLPEVYAFIKDYCTVPTPFNLDLPDHKHPAANGSRRSPTVNWNQRALRGVEALSGTIPVSLDSENLALWLASERIADELQRQAKEAYSDGRRLTLSNEERKKRLISLRKKLHETELLEAWHLWALIEEAGMDLVPRKELSPRALLQIV